MQFDQNTKILIVDDFSIARRIVRNLLVELGFSLMDEAEDGEQAWSKLQTTHYDLIISDWNMPHMDGIELLQRVRETPSLQSTLFLLISAEAKRQQVLQATQAGVDGYLVKPFSATVLHDKIRQMLAAKSPDSSDGH